MNYEISREVFKQRLMNRSTFALIELGSKKISDYKDVHFLESQEAVTTKFNDKNQNILLFNLEDNKSLLTKAAAYLAAQGYHFVYYFCGSNEDTILDKGLN